MRHYQLFCSAQILGILLICFLRCSAHYCSFSSVQILNFFDSVLFGVAVAIASFLRSKFWHFSYCLSAAEVPERAVVEDDPACPALDHDVGRNRLVRERGRRRASGWTMRSSPRPGGSRARSGGARARGRAWGAAWAARPAAPPSHERASAAPSRPTKPSPIGVLDLRPLDRPPVSLRTALVPRVSK